MLLNALEIEPAMQRMAQPTTPRLRLEPRQREAEVVTLVVDGWIGKKQFCEARVLERRAESLTVIAAAPLEEGEQIWFTEDDPAGGMFVRSAAQEGGGFRLELQRERRRSPRWRVDELGEVEWSDADKVRRVSVVVVDVSAGGLRFRTTEDVPESGEVRVKFAGMVRDGEVRYALPLGGAVIVGVEFA